MNTPSSNPINKTWDYAWSTEEMRINRRNWSLAGDVGLLKHLENVCENLSKQANATQNAMSTMNNKLDETSLMIDNITNTSLALANTQFIESRVQEDNSEIDIPEENIQKSEHDFNAKDLINSVFESIKEGLSVMEENYEKVEVDASESEDEDEEFNSNVIFRPKDPYQDRPLPYVIGSEQWYKSNKGGLESSSSESEHEEENVSESENEEILQNLGPPAHVNTQLHRQSSTSSSSNDFNNENINKVTDRSRLYSQSQDTLNSDTTEPETPASILPRAQNVNPVQLTFAEELAKRLGNVVPEEKTNYYSNDSKTKDSLFPDNKAGEIFSPGTNLFSDEQPIWKDRVSDPKNNIIIPASMDMPPPITETLQVPKSAIDDLFGDNSDDSDDSDDIFSNKDIQKNKSLSRQVLNNKILNEHKNVDDIQNIRTSTPETYNKVKGLFEEEDDGEDLFNKKSSRNQSPDVSHQPESLKKKPIGGVSIFGKVDILASNKFLRQTSSSSENESVKQKSTDDSNNVGYQKSYSQDLDSGKTIESTSSTGNNTNPSSALEAENVRNSGNHSGTAGSSGIFMQQQSINNTAGSSSGTDFQPLMTSSRLKSEEFYRERVASDSLFTAKTRLPATPSSPAVEVAPEDVTEDNDDVFGPPPLPKASDSKRQKSKVASLFDDSDDSSDDLFGNPSPASSLKSQTSSQATPVKFKHKNIFDDEDDYLFKPKEIPEVDLFGSAPVQSTHRNLGSLFPDEPPDDYDEGLFVPKVSSVEKQQTSQPKLPNLFDDNDSEDSDLFAPVVKKTQSKYVPPKDIKSEPISISKPAVVEATPEAVVKSSEIIFEDQKDFSDPELPELPSVKSQEIKNESEKLGFGASSEINKSADLSESPLPPEIINPPLIKKTPINLFGEDNDNEDSDLFSNIKSKKIPKGSHSESLFAIPNPITKEVSQVTKKTTTGLFDDSDEDYDDLFGKNTLKGQEKITTKMLEESNEQSVTVKSEKVEENFVVAKNSSTKNMDKLIDSKNIFDGENNDDDNKKNRTSVVESEKNLSASDETEHSDKNVDGSSVLNAKTLDSQNDVDKRKALFNDMRQKLEKLPSLIDRGDALKTENLEPTSDLSSVDGAMMSKREPPKSLALQQAENNAPPTKKAVSGKIKNLMGKMGDFKILSPSDSPPVWRKTSADQKDIENQEDKKSQASTPSIPSGESSPCSPSTASKTKDSPSPNTEIPISFDEPAQVEVLDSEASKSRARIRSKRRPPSRQARQSALRHSGIDFDVVDASKPTKSEVLFDDENGTDLSPEETTRKLVDDKSEITFSKDSTNKNTLLSPSTDEEDLFDVPPDLPDDNLKEDSLFSRAPIISPIKNLEEIIETKKEPVKIENKDIISDAVEQSIKSMKKNPEKKELVREKTLTTPDPLQDENHDPLEHPSQLFAFVTKTTSPKKNKTLFSGNTDDSLFSGASQSLSSDQVAVSSKVDSNKKPVLDLFVDDDDGDLFSTSKIIKKPLKDTKIGLFDDIPNEEDDDNSLFGSNSSKKKTQEEIIKAESVPETSSSTESVSAKKVEPLKSDDNTGSKTSKIHQDDSKTAPNKTIKVKDIFDNSSDEDDLFSNKKIIPKKPKKSLFDDIDSDENDNSDIFGKPKLLVESKSIIEKPVKKSVTRDLRKTAEQIKEDPLSLLEDE